MKTRAIDDIISESSESLILNNFLGKGFVYFLDQIKVLEVPICLTTKLLCHTKCSNEVVFTVLDEFQIFLMRYAAFKVEILHFSVDSNLHNHFPYAHLVFVDNQKK